MEQRHRAIEFLLRIGAAGDEEVYFAEFLGSSALLRSIVP
jgi:hypothetical protein